MDFLVQGYMYTQLYVQVQSSGPLNAFCKCQKIGQYNMSSKLIILVSSF